MLRFAEIDYLYLLYLVPIIIFIFWFTNRMINKSLLEFSNKIMHSILFPLRSKAKQITKFVIYIIAILLIIIGLSNPQIGTKIEEVKQVGIDVYILLDVSLSMTAEDIKPSRLEKAKFEIAKLIQRLRGDRIGLIVFSGEAYVQFPLTTDYAAANLFLSAVDVKTVPQPGTAIGPAIELAINSFKKDADTKKAIIVITDGEDHEGDLDKIVDSANEKEIGIYAIGLGSPNGVPIPVYNASGMRIGYKSDNQGNTVLTKLDEVTLKSITEKGNVKYYRGSNSDDELELIYNELSKLDQAEFGATRITEYEDRFYYFLIPAIILLIIEFFISSNKTKFFKKLEEEEMV